MTAQIPVKAVKSGSTVTALAEFAPGDTLDPGYFPSQVNADWDASSGVAQILNKPVLGTAAAQDVGAFATAAQGAKADAAVPTAQVGIANGVAPLGSDNKLAVAYLPDSVLGGVSWQGFWDASAGTPPTTTPQKGWYYIVNVAGTTSLGGITDWNVGDWAIYSGTAWGKVDNTDSVSSVAGLVGVISAASLITAMALATVATSGSYNDLSNKPTIPTLTFPVRTINAQTGTTYTPVLTDGNSATAPGTIIQASNAAAITHTIPTNASVAYPVGAELYFTQTGAGQLTLAGASGVTLNTAATLKARAQGSTIGLYKSDTNVWYAFGDLA